ncbi:MAG: hypothetical protein M3Q36_02210 [bacterium]|nr:hypothetical protein [bacterium]
MEDVKLPDLSKVRGSDSKRELPPQTSAEDTSNWENRAIALPNPKRPYAEFIFGGNDLDFIDRTVNPYLEQERLKSIKTRNRQVP